MISTRPFTFIEGKGESKSEKGTDG